MFKDYVGFGALGEALLALESGGFSRVFVVASQGGWQRFNAGGKRDFFAKRTLEVFSGFSNNPDFKEILQGEQAFRAFRPDLIVAVGGGSAMDVAKVIKTLAFTRQPYDSAKPESMIPSGDGPPLVAIATTSGTGSEATQYAVFYVGEVKQSLANPLIRPEMAVVDPEMTYSLPPDQTAMTGFDALCQSVEAHWAAAATPESAKLTTAAIRYIIPNLHKAVTDPDPGSRYHMAQAAYLSGEAINITRLTFPHALGYHLTKRYGLSHGHAVAMTLPFFFMLNLEPDLKATTPGGQEAVRRVMADIFAFMGQPDGAACFAFWRGLMRSCGLKASLAEVGLTTEKAVRDLVASANPTRVKNHPVEVLEERMTAFFLEHDRE